jgi:hypothetical protein
LYSASANGVLMKRTRGTGGRVFGCLSEERSGQ